MKEMFFDSYLIFFFLKKYSERFFLWFFLWNLMACQSLPFSEKKTIFIDKTEMGRVQTDPEVQGELKPGF